MPAPSLSCGRPCIARGSTFLSSTTQVDFSDHSCCFLYLSHCSPVLVRWPSEAFSGSMRTIVLFVSVCCCPSKCGGVAVKFAVRFCRCLKPLKGFLVLVALSSGNPFTKYNTGLLSDCSRN